MMKKNVVKKWAASLGIVLLLLVLQGLAFPAQEKNGKKVPFRVPKLGSKFKIDGILNEDAWKKALVLELKYEVDPGENIAPPVKTEVLIAYGKNHLYVAFRAYDPDPSQIRATVHDRDSMGSDGYVGVALDTFNDSRVTYNFFCNPLGIQSDSMSSPQGGGASWDAIWHSAGKIYDWGYAVEMAIPFSSLQLQNKKSDQIWGVDAVRAYPRSVRHLIGLFPRDRNNNCYMCQSEKLIGFGGLSRQKNLEITPTVSGFVTQERDSFPNGDFQKVADDIEAGITARWGFTPNMTLSATVNPDFSNVEADVAQLDINKQFALFYPEKRPFFLEGANIFNTRMRIVNTRSLADPNGGIKLTGKEGRHTLGFFSVLDNITNVIVPGSRGSASSSLDMHTVGSVARYRLDVGKASSVGLMATDREGEDYFNRLVGFDANLLVTRKDIVMFQLIGSQTRYPDQIVAKYGQSDDLIDGTAVDFFYVHNTRSLDWFFGYQEITPGFRSDLGFIPQVDFVNYNIGTGYSWRRNPGFWYTMLNFGGGYQIEKDHDKVLIYEAYKLWFNYDGPAQSYLDVELDIGTREYMGVEFRNNYVEGKAGFRAGKNLAFRVDFKYGDQIDFTNVQLGKILTLSPVFRWKAGTHFDLLFGHDYEWLDVAGGRLYTANLTNLKLIYQFNKRTFLRTILQYANHTFDSSLYNRPRNPRYKHLFSQILFSYKINPQTVLFIGYSDDYFGFQGIDLTQNSRTAFIKIGYALRL